jgi:hypothetical protein
MLRELEMRLALDGQPLKFILVLVFRDLSGPSQGSSSLA